MHVDIDFRAFFGERSETGDGLQAFNRQWRCKLALDRELLLEDPFEGMLTPADRNAEKMTIHNLYQIVVRAGSFEGGQADQAIGAIRIGEQGPETFNRRVKNDAGVEMDGVRFHERRL
jgi:hypothetical protein